MTKIRIVVVFFKKIIRVKTNEFTDDEKNCNVKRSPHKHAHSQAAYTRVHTEVHTNPLEVAPNFS